MIEPDEIKFKDAEIRWCWEMFDRIIELVFRDSTGTLQTLEQINILAKLGLKGRKDEWDE
jgi:hypothetical protein